DMDSIVSALAYAELKRAQGVENCVAARCGNTNERIDYVLDRFGFEAPVYMGDVSPRVADVMAHNVISAHEDEPVYDAVERIGDSHFRGLPVVDDRGVCKGLISSFKITSYLFPPRHSPDRSREVKTSLEGIIDTVAGELIAGEAKTEIRSFMLLVASMQTDTFKRRLAERDCSRVVLIVGDRGNIHRIAIESGVQAIIFSGNILPSEEMLELARERGVTLIRSPYDTATTVLFARSAVHAGDMLQTDFISLRPEMGLKEARRMVAMSPQFAFPVLDEEGRLIGILSKSDFLKPIPRQLILVDHNEMSQAVQGAEVLPIVEILDHHRIGTVRTEGPILFLNRPVGSTSTIVATQYVLEGVPIPERVAGILMAGLISDTLNLSSPTTTQTDHEMMRRLSEITGIDPGKLAEEIFSVGSPLQTMSAKQAATADMKEYEEAGQRFSIAQIEEMSSSLFEEKRPDLLLALEEVREARGLLFAALLVTDVNTQNSILLVCGASEFCEHIDYPEEGEGTWRLDGVVSRKKQLLPHLTEVLSKVAG
ncbi:MAG: putative manganese-dependent inorganic diphosphatase, partial [Chthoniobacterales bacterium]